MWKDSRGFLLNKYFPDEEGWSKVFQYLVPELKRPYRVVENFHGERTYPFTPVIYVELKSKKGDSIEKGLDQATSNMTELVDNLGEDFAIFLIIIKEHYIAFFEYHYDRSNLVEDGVSSFKGAVPFNHAHSYDPSYSEGGMTERPQYNGVDYLEVYLEEGDRPFMKMGGIFLDLVTEGVTVQRVLNWMQKNKSLDITPRYPRTE
jgi:hypothetical protein